ncbi:PA0069 family radical SAM protein [Rhodocytophaga aerolata]|uniref:PA0069 family radical SAM protein n=1 Tax=Rhodocytophaga aerolata TaxID=455078 RepID=A0ABT8R3K6_9BACT|nr:PA0069 family radical SAM protein [Rhodocytophaga aerolata]MDO1446673.1 PA0069 family radical SAM protein [Rhodocytophaga aerolata]
MNYHKGRGAQINTGIKFSETQTGHIHLEGIDEETEGSSKTELLYEHPKKIVNTIESPDLYAMRSVNPYQGCEHGCIYCYARNSHEFWGYSAGLDFERKIIVKQQAASVLEQEFLKKTWKPAPISLSGNTDCYQPVERKLEITRSLLKVFVKYAHPVSIITKNSLVLRDIDLLQELAKNNLVHVYISITSLDEAIRMKMEPRTATAKNRLQTVQKLTESSIPVGVMVAPLIPSLNHMETPGIIKAAADHGAITAGYTVVRLNGAVQEIFQDWLHKNFPDRATKVWNQIAELHGGQVNDSQWGRRMVGEGVLAQSIAQLFSVAKQKYMKGGQMPPYDLTKFQRGGNLNLFS